MSAFLDAYNAKRPTYTKRFDCPATGMSLRMEKPRYRDRRAAEARAYVLWREQSGEDVVLAQFADLARACLIGQCLFVDDARQPLGDTVHELDEQLLEHYDAILRSIENPPIEHLSDELLDEMIEELRGKSERVVQRLNVSADSMLDILLRYMARQLSS